MSTNFDSFPTCILPAQADIHSLAVRLFFRFPTQDGDGLPGTRIISTCGIVQNNKAADIDTYDKTSWFLSIASTVGKEMRCRLVGYDTQESPIPGEERLQEFPQPFWNIGQTFLIAKLSELLGYIRPDNAALMVDCFSIDLF